MISPYVPPQDDPPEVLEPTRGVVWVVQASVAITAIAAWVVLMWHVVLVVRAEYKLRSMLDQASVFSALPDVNRNELSQYVLDRTDRSGWTGVSVAISRDIQQPGKWKANSISVPANEMVPPALQWVAEQFGAPRQVTVDPQKEAQSRLFRSTKAG